MADPGFPPTAQTFEFSGGEPCLDFSNTWADRGRPETDQLHGYGDLLAFALQAGLLEAEAGGALAELARTDPAAAERAHAAAHQLRESLYGLFAARARNRPLAARDLDRFNQHLAAALPRLRIESSGEGLRWNWQDAQASLHSPLWPIVRSAAGLLTTADLDLVRECDGSQCTWLFLDHSRGRSRRWCSIASCGNRAKARRHYQRKAGE